MSHEFDDSSCLLHFDSLISFTSFAAVTHVKSCGSHWRIDSSIVPLANPFIQRISNETTKINCYGNMTVTGPTKWSHAVCGRSLAHGMWPQHAAWPFFFSSSFALHYRPLPPSDHVNQCPFFDKMTRCTITSVFDKSLLTSLTKLRLTHYHTFFIRSRLTQACKDLLFVCVCYILYIYIIIYIVQVVD